VCYECSVLSGRGLCDRLITRPEEFCRLWSVVCDFSPAEIFGSNPTGGMDVCVCFVSVVCCTGRGLRDRLITRPEEYYRLWFVVICGLETS
jgi:hypothetical protein